MDFTDDAEKGCPSLRMLRRPFAGHALGLGDLVGAAQAAEK